MNETVGETFEVVLPEQSLSKFERERHAFLCQLPELLKTHSGLYVAIHDGQVIDSGASQVEVALRAQQRVGNVALFVHLVSAEPEPVYRSGVIRDLGQKGTSA